MKSIETYKNENDALIENVYLKKLSGGRKRKPIHIIVEEENEEK